MSRDRASFNDKARGAYVGYVPKPGDRISVVQDSISSDQLWEHFIRKRAPVVIDGHPSDIEWKGDQWTDLDYLRDRAGAANVKIEPIHANGHFGTAIEREEVPLSLFLDMLGDAEMAGQFYLTTQYDEPSADAEDSEEGESQEAVEVKELTAEEKAAAAEAARIAEEEAEAAEAAALEAAEAAARRAAKGKGNADHPPPRDDSETLLSSSRPRSPALSTTSTLTREEMAELDPILPPPTGALADDFPIAPSIMGGLALQQCNLWLGNCKQGKSSGLHHDHADNLYVLLSGRKRFLLWPPIAYAWLQPRGNVEGLCHNGLLLYTPPGEYPSWHPENNRLPLRPDGLTEQEAAEWRVRARQRVLRLANDKAAVASGEGQRKAALRKGKGKQTQEQVEALERLAAAETDHQAILLEERGLYIDDDDDEEDDSTSRIDPTRLRRPAPLIKKRRVARLSSDLDINSDDVELSSEAEAEEEEEEEEDDEEAEESSVDASKLSEKDRAARQRRKHFEKLLNFIIHHSLESEKDRKLVLNISDGAWPEIARRVCGAKEPRTLWSDREALFRAPLVQLLRQPGEPNMDELLAAIGRAWSAIGMDARGHYLSRNQGVKRGSTDDEPGVEADDAKEAQQVEAQPKTKRAKRSPPLQIPPGMLPGGLRGRIDGDEFDSDDYDEYDQPVYDDVLMTMGSGDEEEAMDRDFELRAELQESFAATVAADNARASEEARATDSTRPTQLAQRLAQRTLEEDDEESLGSQAEVSSISRSVAEDRMARAGQHFEGVGSDDYDSDEDSSEEEEDDEEEEDNEPPSFSKISPQALHRYFGLPDDPTQPDAPPPPLAPEELGPLPRCPPPLVVDLRPGQMLYLPASWWHEVTSFAEDPIAEDGQANSDESKPPPVHMAFNYWFHPPTALYRGVAPGLVPARSAAAQAAAAAPKAQGASSAGGAGSARLFTGREVGTAREPYLDFEIWDEIRRAIDARIKKEIFRAEEQIVRAQLEAENMAEDEEEE